MGRANRFLDPTSPIPWFIEKPKEENSNLIISFSSSPEIFEWYKTIESYRYNFPYNRFYIIDPNQIWWHSYYKEIGGFGPLALSNFLKEKIKELNINRVITLGASRGGYGSIMFGCLLNADLSLAFSPQTTIDKNVNKKYRIFERVETLQKESPEFYVDDSLVDLRSVLDKYGQQNKTKYKIFYGIDNIGDKRHAENMSIFDNVELIKTNSASHKISKMFIVDGTVKGLIEETFGK